MMSHKTASMRRAKEHAEKCDWSYYQAVLMRRTKEDRLRKIMRVCKGNGTQDAVSLVAEFTKEFDTALAHETDTLIALNRAASRIKEIDMEWDND